MNVNLLCNNIWTKLITSLRNFCFFFNCPEQFYEYVTIPESFAGTPRAQQIYRSNELIDEIFSFLIWSTRLGKLILFNNNNKKNQSSILNVTDGSALVNKTLYDSGGPFTFIHNTNHQTIICSILFGELLSIFFRLRRTSFFFSIQVIRSYV